MSKKVICLFCFILVLCMVPADPVWANLIGWWKFDEGSGRTASDSSGNEHHGTLNGNPVWALGQEGCGGALEFHPDKCTGIDCGVFDPTNGTGQFTVALWAFWDGTGTYQHFLTKSAEWGTDTMMFQFELWGAHTEAAYTDRVGVSYADAGSVAFFVMPKNEWVHIALTFDGSNASIFLNGVDEEGPKPFSIGPDIDAQVEIGYTSTRPSGIDRTFEGRLDEFRIYDTALAATEIQRIMICAPPGVASNPNPADTATDVSQKVVLGWTPGEFASTHDVYMGTIFEDVNDADRDNPLDVLHSQGQDANTYDPEGNMEFAQTYYWRIDEVNAPPDNTIFTGDIWSFTTEPVGYPISGGRITATASSSAVGNAPDNAVNGSGLDESGLLHINIGGDNMWLSSPDGNQPSWIEFEFDKVYKLHEMWVWNYNDSLEPLVGLGFREVTIEYSTDGLDYTTLGTAHEFSRASGMEDYAHNTTVDFGGAAAKFVRLTANSNWGDILEQYGLSEVRFFQIPVQAREPSPTPGTVDVTLEPTLSWRAGRGAVVHNLYFSDDEQAVIDGTADVVTVADTSYGPLSLAAGKTYYWRVDEVNEAETPNTWQGEVWDFSTFEYFVIDDMEDYNDYPPDRIYDTWIDGWGIATNGSTIGYPNPNFNAGEHFVETTIVHSGSQSMPYFFDNTAAGNSEATLTLSTLRNWNEKGIGSLTLWFRGNPIGFMEEPAGTYTITASGTDIWDTADEFRYVYKQLSGPGSIIARVESVEDTDPWAKAGVMIRQSLEQDSKFAAVYITPGNGCRFQARQTPGSNATSDTSVATAEQMAITAPYWVKLERDTANNFNSYYSSDGLNWVAMSWNPQNIAMPADVYIGLVLTSHNAGVTCTAVISNVQTTGTVSPQTWAQEAIGIEMPSNDAEPMYVVINGSAVSYNEDPDAALTGEWTEWNIDLQEFADQGVDLTDVDKLGIGFGDRDNPQPGGAGLVFFDDIRLYPSRTP